MRLFFLIFLFFYFGVNTSLFGDTFVGRPIIEETITNAQTFQSAIMDFNEAQGYSIQFNLDCSAGGGVCDADIKFYASIDNVNFVEIPELATNVTTTTEPTMFNNVNGYFRWLRVDVTNNHASSIVVNAYSALKAGL